MKILFYQRASIQKAYNAWMAGTYYAHPLFGIGHLPRHGIEVEIFNVEAKGLAKWINRLTRNRYDYIFHTFRMLTQQKPYDLIYGSTADGMQLMAVLRKIRLINIPLCCIVHAIETDKLRGLRRTLMQTFLSGLDYTFFLSSSMQRRAIKHFNLSASAVLPWGYDLEFIQQHEPNLNKRKELYFLCTGKTRRDYKTLLNAFEDSDAELLILHNQTQTFKSLNPNISIQFIENTPQTPLRLLKHYQHCIAVLIPVKDSEHICGTTNMFDAMVMGIPIIMTRNAHLEIDIEKENIGIFVDVGDPEAWKAAIHKLSSSTHLRATMGENARKLVHDWYNNEHFTKELTKHLTGLV